MASHPRCKAGIYCMFKCILKILTQTIFWRGGVLIYLNQSELELNLNIEISKWPPQGIGNINILIVSSLKEVCNQFNLLYDLFYLGLLNLKMQLSITLVNVVQVLLVPLRQNKHTSSRPSSSGFTWSRLFNILYLFEANLIRKYLSHKSICQYDRVVFTLFPPC